MRTVADNRRYSEIKGVYYLSEYDSQCWLWPFLPHKAQEYFGGKASAIRIKLRSLFPKEILPGINLLAAVYLFIGIPATKNSNHPIDMGFHRQMSRFESRFSSASSIAKCSASEMLGISSGV